MGLTAWLRAQWDRISAGGALLLGVVFLYVGWRGVADAALTAQQMPYVVSGGLGGIFLLAIAATLWISADLRDEWRKLDALHDELKRQRGAADGATTEAPNAPLEVRDTEAPLELATNGQSPPARRPLRAR